MQFMIKIRFLLRSIKSLQNFKAWRSYVLSTLTQLKLLKYNFKIWLRSWILIKGSKLLSFNQELTNLNKKFKGKRVSLSCVRVEGMVWNWQRLQPIKNSKTGHIWAWILMRERNSKWIPDSFRTKLSCNSILIRTGILSLINEHILDKNPKSKKLR